MINKENIKEEHPDSPKKDEPYIDTAKMDVQCHIIIRDKDTDKVLVNKRG